MSEPYWTAFRIDGADPNELHCTHKFLGELSDADVKTVQAIIAHYFQYNLMPSIRLVFETETYFGQDADVRVLISSEATSKVDQFGGLRKLINKFRKDDFGEYTPHVTTDAKIVDGRVTSYVLMRGAEIVHEWKAMRMKNARDRELPPIKETTDDFIELERQIKEAFRKAVYFPILRSLGVSRDKLSNAKTDITLKSAIASGRITFNRGRFRGRFNAQISKELRSLGAVWDKKTATYQIPSSVLPQEIRQAIAASSDRFEKTLKRIDDQIRQILPAEIAGKVESVKLFDSSLWKVDRKIDTSLESISVLPKLTPERRRKIADEWRDNLDLWITDFAAEEIPKLRDQIQKHAMAGGRYEDIVSTLQKSYGVTENKARFLARQETSLLMTKFKETRYSEAGVTEYKWGCVAGSKNHPVRPSHKILDGKIFSWSNPPITTAPGEPVRRNNPGQDFNCRCFARPIVRA